MKRRGRAAETKQRKPVSKTKNKKTKQTNQKKKLFVPQCILYRCCTSSLISLDNAVSQREITGDARVQEENTHQLRLQFAPPHLISAQLYLSFSLSLTHSTTLCCLLLKALSMKMPWWNSSLYGDMLSLQLQCDMLVFFCNTESTTAINSSKQH